MGPRSVDLAYLREKNVTDSQNLGRGQYDDRHPWRSTYLLSRAISSLPKRHLFSSYIVHRMIITGTGGYA